LTWVRERRLNPDDPDDVGGWNAALKRARIPDRYWAASPAQVKGDPRWLQKALAYPEEWAGKGYGFHISGPFNTGKTACAALLMMEFIRRCHSVLWLSVREVPGVRFHDGALAALDDRLQTADMVVLDDLGAERFKIDGPAGAALEETVRIVTERGRSITFTSNDAWESFPITYAAMPAFVSVVQRHTVPIRLFETWPQAPELGR
jgi:DNA replication protein DnaC